MQLPDDACDERVYLTLSKFDEIQYLLRIDYLEKDGNELGDDSEQHDLASNEEVDHLRDIVTNTRTELNIIATKYDGLKKTICLLSLFSCLLLFVLIMSKCIKASLIILGVTMLLLVIETYKLYKR